MFNVLFSTRKISILSIVLMLSLALSSSVALAGNDPKLSMESAQAALQKIDPNIKVLSTSASVLDGFWEIVLLDRNGKKSILYLNDKKQILIAGSLFDLNARLNLTALKLQDLNRVDVASIALEDALVIGNAKAPNRVIVFDDPD